MIARLLAAVLPVEGKDAPRKNKHFQRDATFVLSLATRMIPGSGYFFGRGLLGFAAASRAAGQPLMKGGDVVNGREKLREMMRTMLGAEHVFQVSRRAEWTLRALSGGPINRRTYLQLLASLVGVWCTAVLASDSKPAATEARAEGGSSMSDESAMRDLFDRWERVWHEGQYDLVLNCVAEHYIRHDEGGERTVTLEAYAAEIAKTRQERPDIRVVVYDHSFKGDRAWFRFAFKWADPKTREPRSRAGMQSYRIDAGKLAETWLAMMPLGSTWTDAVAQEHWTSAPPIK